MTNISFSGRIPPELAQLADDEPDSSQILQLLRKDGLISHEKSTATPLLGGIASDIFLVQDGDRRFVVKRALERMKVQDLWLADVSRNRTEYEYLRYVGANLPGAVPAVLAQGDGYFTMEYLGSEIRNWKEMLLTGDCEPKHAAQAGKILGTIHRLSAGDRAAERLFDTTRNFHQCRVDPYLLTTGARHPELKPYFEAEAARLESTHECLVQGDYSPKNILIGETRQVLLDCEVAWYGDPAFDLSFLLNHILLKGLYHAPKDLNLYALAAQAFDSYHLERQLSARQRHDFDCRIVRLLPLLSLARIDGKSPVEYLQSDEKKEFVRRFVVSVLPRPSLTVDHLISAWFEALKAEFHQS